MHSQNSEDNHKRNKLVVGCVVLFFLKKVEPLNFLVAGYIIYYVVLTAANRCDRCLYG